MSLNPYPAFAYSLPFTGTKMQAVHGSERPAAAMLAAYASMRRGERIAGAGRMLSDEQLVCVFQTAAASAGVPWYRFQRWARGINANRLTGVTNEPICGMTPSQYQLLAASHLTVAGGTLAMGVGLGKTITAMVAARAYHDTESVGLRCWIVCPLAAMPAWRPYLDWLRDMYPDVQLVSVDSAHKLVGADTAKGGLLILDEAHYAGHIDARRTKALHKIRLAFDACVCLTGTLLHSGIEAALNVLDLAVPGSVGFATKWTAGEYFRCIEKIQLSTGRTVAKLEKPGGESRVRFIDFVSRYAIAMAKDSEAVKNELTIPEQHLHTVDMDGCDEASEDAAIDCLVRIVREKYLDAGLPMPHASKLGHDALAEGAGEKLGWLLEQMADDDQPVAVFAEYHETLDFAEKVLTEAKISYARVDGMVAEEDRARIVADFQAGKIRVFLGQIDATGLSINLFTSHLSVTLDLTQKANNYAQMLGRTCRRGQTEECHHFDLIANPVQRICLSRLRAGEDFNQSLVKYHARITERLV
jgi:hypothetical protein